MDKLLIEDLIEEIDNVFYDNELLAFPDFEAFYQEVEIYNAYEEEWFIGRYKAEYKLAFERTMTRIRTNQT